MSQALNEAGQDTRGSLILALQYERHVGLVADVSSEVPVEINVTGLETHG